MNYSKQKADFLTLSLEPFAYVTPTYWSPAVLAFWLFLEHSECLCITGRTLCLECSSLLSVANSLTSFKPCFNANLPEIPIDLRLQPTFSLVSISWPQYFSEFIIKFPLTSWWVSHRDHCLLLHFSPSAYLAHSRHSAASHCCMFLWSIFIWISFN